MDIASINSKVMKLWESQEITTRLPHIYPENLKTNCLLFIGMNPSFSRRGYQEILRNTDYKDILDELDDFVKFRKLSEVQMNLHMEIEKIAKEEYRYFSKFKDIAKQTGLEWEHIDLLFVRDTNQQNVERLLREKNEFILNQVTLSIDLIELIDPVIIVVENAFASKFLKERLKLKWDENKGVHMYNEKPVFLSGMLTGQRALDLGSYKRLIWHINYVNQHQFKVK